MSLESYESTLVTTRRVRMQVRHEARHAIGLWHGGALVKESGQGEGLDHARREAERIARRFGIGDDSTLTIAIRETVRELHEPAVHDREAERLARSKLLSDRLVCHRGRPILTRRIAVDIAWIVPVAFQGLEAGDGTALATSAYDLTMEVDDLAIEPAPIDLIARGIGIANLRDQRREALSSYEPSDDLRRVARDATTFRAVLLAARVDLLFPVGGDAPARCDLTPQEAAERLCIQAGLSAFARMPDRRIPAIYFRDELQSFRVADPASGAAPSSLSQQ